MENIIIAFITIAIPSITTLITSHSNKKEMEMHNAKQSILQMITEDKVRVLSGNIPENYQAILLESDIYDKKGGNSYLHEKVNDYKDWYANNKKKGN